MEKILFAIGVSACLFFGCTKEVAPEAFEQPECFTASFLDESRTSVSGSDVLWEKGDQISVNGYVYKAETAGKTSVFTAVKGDAPEAGTYVAAYPSSLKTNSNTVSGVLGSRQTARAGNVPADCNHSVARSATRNLYFRNLLSLVKVNVNAPGVASVSVKAKSGEALSGDYTAAIGDDAPVLTPGSSVSDAVELVPAAGESCFQEGSTYIFTAFPTALAGGLEVTFTFDSAHGGGSWSRTFEKQTSLKRSTVLDLGIFEYDFESGTGRMYPASAITASIDLESSLSEPVSGLLFSSFGEMHGGDYVPGIIEQYLVNQSFEPWYSDAPSSKTEIVFTDVVAMDGVAYPWQFRKDSGAPEVSIADDCYNTSQAQKITVSAGQKGTLYQKVALPTYRTMNYKVRFFAKVSGTVSLSSCFTTSNVKVMSEKYEVEGLETDWKCFEHVFTVAEPASYRNNRYGIYNLTITASGEGSVILDNVTLFPSDVVEGKFNPETIQYFKDFKVASIRWPGGNAASQYHWKNVIGETDKRKVMPNRAWNGLDANLLGIDEVMRFCELTGTGIVMGLGYGEITQEEIVDLVEYCNGSTSTEMGALRAENGHPAPYDIEYWGIGNEVYGDYQIGHCSVDQYSAGMKNISAAVKAVDPSAKVIASAYGIHNTYRDPSSTWTASLLSQAGSSLDLIDTHCYVYGPSSISSSMTADDIILYFSAANLNVRKHIETLKSNPDFASGKKLALTEWGVLPNYDTDTPKRQTFSNMIASACLYNEYIRQSDVVKIASLHNFSIYVAPQSLHSEPVNARTHLLKELAPLSGGYCVSVDESSIPTYDLTQDFLDIGKQEDVPYVDIAAVRKDGNLYLSIANRNPSSKYTLILPVKGANVTSAEGVNYTSTLPYAIRKWTQYRDLEPVVSEASISGVPGSSPIVVLPPLSYTMVKLKVVL